MAFSPSAWSQIRNKTADDLIAALERDEWELEPECKGQSRFIEVPMDGVSAFTTIHT